MRLLRIATIALATLCGSVAPGAPRLALAPGELAPEMRGYELEGGEYRLVDWTANRLTVLNFWATWCVPCQEEMPTLQRLADTHAEDGLEVIGVHSQQVSDLEIRSFTHLLGVRYPIMRTVPAVMRNWGGISALPTTFLINHEGRVLRRYVGATPEQIEGLATDVSNVLAGRPMGPLVEPAAPNVATQEGGTQAQSPAEPEPPQR